MKYFIGNWKMFGVPKSIDIIKKVTTYKKRDKFNKKYKIVFTPPFTLIESFSNFFKKNPSVSIGAQNCYHKDLFSSDTGAISSFMIKLVGAKYVIIGHSDNRSEGDTDSVVKQKISHALKNNLKVIFCIGENKRDKIKKRTKIVLKKQILNSLNNKTNLNNIIVAYEPIWSIGTGLVPKNFELNETITFIKKILKKVNKKKLPPVLYGGSVDGNSVKSFKKIKIIDGFLIGGASKSSKNFIDIIKNFYK